MSDRRPRHAWHTLPTILLVGLLTFAVVSAFSVGGRVAARAGSAWRTLNADGEAESAEYDRTPGCWDRAEETDPSLAPCRDVQATVVAKNRRSVHGGDGRGGRWVHHLDSLTVRDANGATRELHDIRNQFYDTVSVGDIVEARVWKGRITRLYAHREWSGTGESPGARMTPEGGLLAGGATTRERRALSLWGGVAVAALLALVALRASVTVLGARASAEEEGGGRRGEY